MSVPPRLAVLLCFCAFAAIGGTDSETAADVSATSEAAPAAATPAPAAAPAAAPASSGGGNVNLLGRARTGSGEGRRNENVQFNLIDNNADKEVAIRLGASATVVRDFKIETNYFGAELGKSPVAPVHLGGRTANGVHGNINWRHLNSITTARSFFQVGEVLPARENDFGARVTTPLWRGAAFTMDGSKRIVRGVVNGNVLVPRADERTPLTEDPEARALVEQMLAVFPNEAPNRPDINERMLNTNSPQGIDDDSLTGRLDQRLGQDRTLVLDYTYLQQLVDAFQLVRTQNPDTTTRSHRARISYAETLSPRQTLQVTAALDRVGSLLTQEATTFTPAVFVSSALTSFGNGSSIPIDRARNLYRVGALSRWTTGAHEITYGGDVFRRQVNGFEADSHRGVYSFSQAFGNDAVTNLRLGLPSAYYRAIGNIHRGFRNWDAGFFVGDKWRAARNLDLTFGLRYSLITAPTEVDELSRIPYDSDLDNVAPTFGFSQRLPGAWGVLRGGFGMHFGEIFDVTYQQVRYNAPQNVKLVAPQPDLLDPLGEFGPIDPATTRGVVFRLDENLEAPYSMQYNFSWELEPARDWLLSLGYVGSRSPKLLVMWYLNRGEASADLPLTLSTINDRRPDVRYLDDRFVVNGSRGYFDAAKAQLRIPSWRGLSVDASYWFSKAIDLGSDYTNTAALDDVYRNRSQSSYDIHADLKGPSRFDSPHAALLRTAYQTPSVGAQGSWMNRVLGRWQLSAVTLLKVGTPFNVEVGSDAPGFGNVDGVQGERPHFVDPDLAPRTLGRPDKLLPREAFGFLEPGENGTLGRGYFRKGAIRNVNASLARRWTVGSEASLTVRAESVNLLNTPQFAEPGSKLTDPNFGVITNTLNEGRTFRIGIEAGF